jgi:hypothetical protein
MARLSARAATISAGSQHNNVITNLVITRIPG